MSALASIPICSDPHAPRPRLKHEPRLHYRPFKFSNQDLLNIDTIQRLTIRAQGKPKQAVSMAAAVRTAITEYAAKLRRNEGAAKRSASPLSAK
ncbi:MAG: hypothetical protein JSR64_04380 [Nitrospira sp.]|nr:hypothetical protein [Nitrospira sp.]MBX3335990.1 hypothetical protein [Nitrospira sp.]MCW5778838.1 hypothetical protein [Nitrospira sp.]